MNNQETLCKTICGIYEKLTSASVMQPLITMWHSQSRSSMKMSQLCGSNSPICDETWRYISVWFCPRNLKCLPQFGVIDKGPGLLTMQSYIYWTVNTLIFPPHNVITVTQVHLLWLRCTVVCSLMGSLANHLFGDWRWKERERRERSDELGVQHISSNVVPFTSVTLWWWENPTKYGDRQRQTISLPDFEYNFEFAEEVQDMKCFSTCTKYGSHETMKWLVQPFLWYECLFQCLFLKL